MPLGGHIKRIRGKLSAEKVAEKIGVSAHALRKWEIDDIDPPKDEDVRKIETYFGKTKDEILETETFPMEAAFVKKDVFTNTVGTAVLTHNDKSYNIPLGKVNRGDLPLLHFVPMVTHNNMPYASGGADGTYDLDTLLKSEIIEFYYSAPDFNKCRVAVTMDGNAMAQRYFDKDRLFLEVRPLKKEIILGEPHLIITTTMKIVRYVFPSDKQGYWILKPENSWYPDQLIEIKSVGAIFQVKGRIG